MTNPVFRLFSSFTPLAFDYFDYFVTKIRN
nr:MAG TPA: hypothetical protein [Bacteriophage sp.]